MEVKKKVGRPSKFTPEVIRKIEEIAALDGTVEEMALFADLNPDTIYAWLKENPVFSERIRQLRNTPILAIRRVVVEKAAESYSNAVDYLKRKRKEEFGDNMKVNADIDMKVTEVTQEEKESLLALLNE